MKRADRFRVTVVPPREGEGDAWYWRIRPPHGKKGETRRSSETTDRAEAEDGARRTADRLNAGVIRPGSDPTALEVFDRFYAAKEMTKTPPGTLKTFRLAHRWLASKLTLPASRLTSGAILAVRDVMETKIAASTCNLYVGCLRRCWGWARARDTMFPGLVAFPKVKDLDEVPTEKRPFYPEEVAAVLQELADFSGGKWLGLFRCLSDSGKPFVVTVVEDLPDDALGARLVRGRLDLRAIEKAYAVAEGELHLAVLRQIPALRLGPYYGRDPTGDGFLGLALGLELPLFDRNQGEIAEKRSARERARAAYVAALHRLRAAAVEARAQVRRARLEVEAQEREVLPLVERNQSLFDGAVKAGELGVLDWVTALQRGLGARQAYLESLVRYQTSVVEYEAALGVSPSRAVPGR